MLRNYKVYKLCIISMIISIVLIGSFASIYHGFRIIIENELERGYEKKELVVYEKDYSGTLEGELTKFSHAQLDALLKKSDVDSIVKEYYYDVDVESFFLENYNIKPPSYVRGVDCRYATFTNARIQSEMMGCSEDSYIVAGRDFEEKDKKVVLLSEKSVLAMGIREIQEVVGKKIRIKVGDNTVVVEVVGIFAKPFANIGLSEDIVFRDEEDRYSVAMEEGAIFSSDVIEKIHSFAKEKQNTEISTSIRISSTSMEGIKRVYDYLSSTIYNGMYCDAALMHNFQLYIRLFTNGFVIIGMVLFLLALYNLYGIMLLVFEKRKKWFAIQKILGFTSFDISICFVFEILWTQLISICIGVAITKLVSMIFEKIVQNEYAKVANSTLFVFPKGLILSVVFFMIFFLGIMFRMVWKEILNINIEYLKRVH